ncbi:hypothetical protein Vretimale_18663 [Volvox reticuliferus]|uniref:Uncharacterized protein n=1 Tax=Volvox reticuliferus TaxID=1737510 RepID=A0A8J4CUZ8_9CHLO|nr:hypothetical protein Vretifemale_17150 [Volvox reticuliferus]GIM15994.1 hypothetical protein Vretimale_18663 [Volvox reticuliferus]
MNGGSILSLASRPSAKSRSPTLTHISGQAPRRGKGGTLASRQALLHSAVHIENWAVDLSWDVVARFGLRPEEYDMPREFFDDFVKVAEDECRHFTALAKRLEELGSHYGAFAVHDGLWESAANTAHSLPARLAVEHCVHEARGLDVLPSTISKFANNGDNESAALLRDVVYPEEISHCGAGVRWIKYLYGVAHGTQHPPSEPVKVAGADKEAGGDVCAVAGAVEGQLARLQVEEGEVEPRQTGGAEGRCQSRGHSYCADSVCGGSDSNGHLSPTASWMVDARNYSSVEAWFHSLVRAHFWGALKPPFNEEARAKAGFGPEWYLPLSVPAQQQQQSG